MEELIFQYVEVRTSSPRAIKALQRGRDGAMIMVRNDRNQWVFGHKKHYPEGISKFIGGGIEADENPLFAAKRELGEEVGVVIDEDRLVPLIHAEVFGQHNGQQVSFSVFVFYAQIHQSMRAGSDVDDLVTLNDAEMHQFLQRFGQLSDEEVIDDGEATWDDWGKIWGPIHRAAFERVKELGL